MLFNALFHVDAEFVGEVADDVWRQYFHAGTQSHHLKFVLVHLAPVIQGSDRDASAVSELLFGHCFHFLKGVKGVY